MQGDDFRQGLERVLEQYAPALDDWSQVTRRQVEAVAAAMQVVIANALLDALEREPEPHK